jgi:ABC-type multidrug transport system fused ATPase/permease subunit
MSLENQRYTQESSLATVRREYDDAVRQAKASEELAKEGMIAHLEFSRTQDTAKELAARLEAETKRLEMIRSSIEPQLAIQREQVQRLQAISQFQRGQVNSMKVVAGAAGVLQGLPLEVGQWVTPGNTLAVVAEPGRLKAVLRIPETQARDVAIGQPASIDTRTGIAKGRVTRIDPAVQNGTVTVDVMLEGALPAGARPDMTVGRDDRGRATAERAPRGTPRPRRSRDHGGALPSRAGTPARGSRAGPARAGLGERHRSAERSEGRRRGHSVGHVGVGRPRTPARPLIHVEGDSMKRDGEPLIRLEGIRKIFTTDEVETHALSGVHLEIRAGEYVSIEGPSGSGKTTLLSILGLLDTPTEGTYQLNGHPVSG